MKPVEIRAEAELDIIEAALWYEKETWGCAWRRSVASHTVCTSSTSSIRSFYLASSISIAIPRFGSIGGEVPPNPRPEADRKQSPAPPNRSPPERWQMPVT
jgi:hypothetical protein